MSNPVLISKRSFDIDGGNIAIEFSPGGGSPATDNISFTGSKTLEEVKIDIDTGGAGIYYFCELTEDYIRIQAIGGNEIISVTITNTNLQDLMGGLFTINDSSNGNFAYSETWGIARVPFVFGLTTTDILKGGVRTKSPILKKLSGKDYIGTSGVSSNKVIFRKGYNLLIRMDFNQVDWLNDFLEFSRNEPLHVINGSDYNFEEANDWSLLTENTDNITVIYDYLDVIEMTIGVLKDAI